MNSTHRQIHAIALPMMLSSVSLPLLGLVDTAILGHLNSPKYLAAVSVGMTAVNMLLWGFGFLRMSTTGLVAQSVGAGDQHLSAHVVRALVVAVALGAGIALLNPWLSQILLTLMAPEPAVSSLAQDFLNIRLYAAPFQLMFFTLCGYFLGSNQAGKVLTLTLISQISNMVLDFVFVVYFDWHVKGVAWGSLLSEAGACGLGLYWLFKNPKLSLLSTLTDTQWWHQSALKQLFQLNRDVFVRTLCLMSVFLFITRQSAAQGELILAVNAVLLNFFYLASYALDGYAHAIESIGGRLYGAAKNKDLIQAKNQTMAWAFLAATLMTMLFWLFGQSIVNALTDIPEVRNATARYLPWLIGLPILACASFVYDGLCIGMTQGRIMRNNLLLATGLGFFAFWYAGQWLLNTGLLSVQVSTNHLLWLAFWTFFLVRTFSIHWQVNAILRTPSSQPT